MQAQLVYLGQRSIEKYGCYSCHNIKGFETLKPIGTELTIEGSKALHLFDFGFAHEYAADQDGKHDDCHGHNIACLHTSNENCATSCRKIRRHLTAYFWPLPGEPAHNPSLRPMLPPPSDRTRRNSSIG